MKTPNTPKRYNKLTTACLAFCSSVLSSPHTFADDTEIYVRSADVASMHPNILFIMDTSGSMSTAVSGDPLGRNRLKVMQDSLTKVLDSISNVNVGLMRYSSPGNYDNNGGPILYPVKYIDDPVSNATIVSKIKQSSDDAAEEVVTGAVSVNEPNLDVLQKLTGGIGGSSGTNTFQFGNASDYSEDATVGKETGSPNYAGFGKEYLGWRFTNIKLDPGVIIDDARLTMQTTKTADGPGTAKVQVEDVGNAATYKSGDTAKDRSAKYWASWIDWTIPKSSKTKIKTYTSGNIASLLQKVVDRADWAYGNAVAFGFKPDSDERSLCTPTNKDSCDDPTLSVTWHNPNPPTPGADQMVGLRFGNVQVPQGAKVISAHIEFVAKGERTSPTDLKIYGQASAAPLTFSTASGDISKRALTTNSTTWSGVESWYDGDTYSSPELKNIVEEIVADPTWCGGNNMALVIKGTKGTRSFLSFDNGDSSLAPKLVVEFDQTAKGCSRGTVPKGVATGSDDAEYTDGAAANVTTDAGLDLDTNTYVGFRFTGLAIPSGATIENASLTMVAKDASTASTSVELYLVNDANPKAFAATPLLASSLMSDKVAWTIPAFTAGAVLVSPNISSLIEKMVAKSSWAPNNAMSLVMKITAANNTGSIKAYENSPGQAAQLSVQYKGQYIPTGNTVRTHLKNVVKNFTADGFTPISGTLAEAAKYFRGEAVTFGAHRGTPPSSKFLTSHPDSWTGGTTVLPTSCPSWDSTSSYCKNTYISGSPKYTSPMDECSPNHILFLSDGLPNSHGGTTAGIIKDIIANTSGAPASACGGDDNGVQCTLDLAKAMVDNDQAPSIARDQYIHTHTISFASNIKFMEDMANAGGGDYYTADNEETLVNALIKFTQTALASSASFVAAGVSVSQFNRLANDDQLYYALFKPADGPQWPGNVKRYQLDTTSNDILGADGKTALSGTGQFGDKAISFWKQSVDPATSTDIADGNNVQLGGTAASMPDSRNVYTWLGTDANLNGSSNLLSETNSAITATMLGDSTMSTTRRDILLKWARGLDVDDIDNDKSTSDIRLQFGDAMHSKPIVVKYDTGTSGPSSDDSAVLFVGTNQGYLHAINASDGVGSHTTDGNELWSFVPKELLPNLATFYDDKPGVTHPYGMDGPIAIYHEDTDHDGLIDSGETAILYAGMRRGGRSYYALDIANRVAPKMKFQIEGGKGDYTELGQTWSAPLVRKIRWNGTDVQAILFGGGYDTNQDNPGSVPLVDTMGRTVFVAEALTGKLLWTAKVHAVDESTIDTSWPSTSNAKVNLVASIPGNLRVIDLDRNGYADTIYASDQNGQIFRFDINEANKGATDFAAGGRIAHLNANTVAGNRRFYYEPDTSLVVLNNEQNFVAIAIGSGYRAHPLDTDTADHIYVLRDYGVLQDKFQWDVALSDLADVSEEVDAKAARILIKDANNKGWFINLGNSKVGKLGEKVLSSTVTFNNTVHITTYIPADKSSFSVCSSSEGSSRLWLVDVIDGTPLERNVKDLEHPQLEERHVDLLQAGIGDTVNILDTGGKQVIQAGLDVDDAVPSPPGTPMKVHRRFKDRTPLTFP